MSKKTQKQKEPVKAINVFQCPNCEGSPEFDGPSQFKDHLQTVHNVTNFGGSKTMTMHVDCSNSYSSNYEWTIGGLKFYQFCTNPRRHGMLRHGL